jgi:hypothetical protein
VDSGSVADCESLGKSLNPEDLYKCLVGSTGLEPVTSTV